MILQNMLSYSDVIVTLVLIVPVPIFLYRMPSASPELPSVAREDLPVDASEFIGSNLSEESMRVREVFREQLGDLSQPCGATSLSDKPTLRRTREERALHRNLFRDVSNSCEQEYDQPGEVSSIILEEHPCALRDMPCVSAESCEEIVSEIKASGKVTRLSEVTTDAPCELFDAMHLSCERKEGFVELAEHATSTSVSTPELRDSEQGHFPLGE
jgi:hypothetical protein